MTTAHSPEHLLRAQAEKVAKTLKEIDAGEKVPGDPLGKIEASRARGFIEFAIAMDDKILKIQISWSTVRELALPLLADVIYEAMAEKRATAH